MVTLREHIGDKKFNDFYSFDNNERCLSHGYSRWEGNKQTVDEKHDTDISRLLEHGATIKEMIGEYPADARFITNGTVISLMGNLLRDNNS